MRIAITGGSGFIGRRLIARLAAENHTVRLLGRAKPRWLEARHEFAGWDALDGTQPSLGGAEAVIHLAGEPVAQRWTAAAKDRMWRSRVEGTRNLVKSIRGEAAAPKVLIAASAIGYYESGEARRTEESPAGSGFLADLSQAWEQEAQAAAASGVRVVNLRIGIVLGQEGGALKQMLTPFRMGVGGPIGDGRQWMSWIHVDDMTGLILFYLDRTGAVGAVNATSPQPVRNGEFARQLGKALHRPAILPVPGFALKLLFGEMASVILASQCVEPARALRDGYRFQHPELSGALANLLNG